MGSKIGNDHIIREDTKIVSSKFLLTVKIITNDQFEYVSHNIPDELEDDHSESDEMDEVEEPEGFQPLGFELKSVNVKTRIPFLLRGNLREYQIIGLDWLKTLHDKKLNGILADEMGLGKTIQTISLLSALACDEGIWGPHLIVVPTTIIINWEMEFKRWCPGLKILAYFGSQKERKMKRTGWSKDNSFHVCITSYKLVIQDHFAFRRKKWYYMVLDEAQNIKNFRSQRWQTLLRFNTKRRLLLTGTPLQNDVMELWSLMHFLMPDMFSSQQDFKEWFSNPFSQSMNQTQSLNLKVVQRLQSILRPFLLRRMKKDVEKQLPEKVEHIVKCDLSRRQRFLYDEYINNNRTQRTLQEADFFSIMNVLMQLRKVCNHPDLFEPRAIESPFFFNERITYNCPKLIWKSCTDLEEKEYIMNQINLILKNNENISIKTFISQIENFPQRSFIEILQNARQKGLKTLQTKRPLDEGDSLGALKPINCNELSINNTEALSITFPGYVSFSYLNAASMPFISSYFSLDHFDELRYKNTEIKFNPDTDYESALRYEDTKRKMIKFGEKLITFAHADYKNRMNLISKPVYGKDCIEACKVPLTFESIMKHKKAKSSTSMKDLEVPCTILNPYCPIRKPAEVMYNRYSNTTFSIENAAMITELKKDIPLEKSDSAVASPLALHKKCHLQPGFPLIIELKSKKNKQKSKKKQLSQMSLLGPKSPSSLIPMYSNFQGKVMYVMSAKLIKKVTLSIPKNILKMTNQEYPHESIENDITVEVKDTVIHKKKKVKTIEENHYEKEYKYTAESRRLKGIEDRDGDESFQNSDNEDSDHEQLNDANLQSDHVQENKVQELPDDIEKCQEQDQIMDNNIKNNENPESETNNEDQKSPELQQNDSKVDNEIYNENNDVEMINEEANVDRTNAEAIETEVNVVETEAKAEGELDQAQNNDTCVNPESEIKQDVHSETIDVNMDATSDCNKQNDLNDDSKAISKGTPEKLKDDEESEEEYSGEGCFIGYRNSDALRNLIVTPAERLDEWTEKMKHFKFITGKVETKPIELKISNFTSTYETKKEYEEIVYRKVMSHKTILNSLKFTNSLYFPHKNLVQYDCGKLHKLSMLLKTLKAKGSKVLIFTQMTKMLDLLEQFLNLHGYTYVRLDGSVKVEMRQKLVDNFNLNKKIFCFISSTRCGGIGINLTGADCVVFYDTDWNPAMDKQAQDRCHRIGQNKTVHIYRLISLNTIEENIFKKSLQKRELGGLIIEGNFDPDFFKKVNYKEILEEGNIIKPMVKNIMHEENILFESGIEGDKEDKDSAEAYRRKYEEVLIKIEDQEDVEAYQNAKHEIDDEFEDMEEDKTTERTERREHQDQASKTLSGVKRYENIDWENNPKLNSITKRGIQVIKDQYTFENFIKDKSEKDANFIDPEEEYKLHKETEEKDNLSDEELSDQSDISEARENYDPVSAFEIYKVAQQQILNL